jgi:glycosyltransferase involved in cell wall biosynthesis
VPAFLRGADCVLDASLSETSGNVVCEAKYAGVPVVALDDSGGVRSQIDDRRTGILVAAADERAFASRLMALRRDVELQNRIRQQARQDVLDHHSPDRVYGNLMRIYEASVRGEAPAGSVIDRLLAATASAAGPKISP